MKQEPQKYVRQIKIWGGSLAITLPPDLLDELNLNPNDNLVIQHNKKEEQLIITKLP